MSKSTCKMKINELETYICLGSRGAQGLGGSRGHGLAASWELMVFIVHIILL